MVLTFLDDFINPCRKKLESLDYVLDNFTIHGHDSIMAQKASLKQLVAYLKVLKCGFHMYLVTWWGGFEECGHTTLTAPILATCLVVVSIHASTIK